MAKYELKTKVTPVNVAEFIEAVADDRQRDDAKKIAAMLERLSGHQPKMWGPSIIGFGSYHYKYASGHEGDGLHGADRLQPAQGKYCALYHRWL